MAITVKTNTIICRNDDKNTVLNDVKIFLYFKDIILFGRFMYKKLTVILIAITVFVCVSVVQAQTLVGVKEGDWIEYEVNTTGTPPEGHNITFARMEILEVQGNEFRANVTSEAKNGAVSNLLRTFDLAEGNVQGWVVIPANLSAGDTFYDSYIGRDILIEGEEERTVAGATRVTTYANTPERYKRWDKKTGVFVETIDTLEDYTIHATAVATNIWAPQIFGVDATLVYTVVIIVAVAVVASIVIIIRRKK